MAVPKRRTSRSNTRTRRARWKTSAPPLVVCGNRGCGQPTLPHMACPACGTYRGRQIVTPA